MQSLIKTYLLLVECLLCFFQDFTDCLSILKKSIRLERMKQQQIEQRRIYQDENLSFASTEYPKVDENVRCCRQDKTKTSFRTNKKYALL